MPSGMTEREINPLRPSLRTGAPLPKGEASGALSKINYNLSTHAKRALPVWQRPLCQTYARIMVTMESSIVWLFKQFFDRFYLPMELFRKITKTFCTDPVIHIFSAIEFAGFICIGLFPAEFAVLMPKLLYFFSLKEFSPFVGLLHIVIRISCYLLIKGILGFVGILPEMGKLHPIKGCIGQIILLSSQSPIFHNAYSPYSRIMVTMDSSIV